MLSHLFHEALHVRRARALKVAYPRYNPAKEGGLAQQVDNEVREPLVGISELGGMGAIPAEPHAKNAVRMIA
jgi:hypothetical protein